MPGNGVPNRTACPLTWESERPVNPLAYVPHSLIWYRETMRYLDFVKVGGVHLGPSGFGVFAFDSRVLLRLEPGFRRPTIAEMRNLSVSAFLLI